MAAPARMAQSNPRQPARRPSPAPINKRHPTLAANSVWSAFMLATAFIACFKAMPNRPSIACQSSDAYRLNPHVLPASRFGRRELVEHVKDPESNDRVGYFGSDPGDPVIAPAGSIVVFGSTVFHRSGANPSGQARRAYLAQYAPTPIQNKPGEWPQYFAEPFLRDGRRVPQARRLLAKRVVGSVDEDAPSSPPLRLRAAGHRPALRRQLRLSISSSTSEFGLKPVRA